MQNESLHTVIETSSESEFTDDSSSYIFENSEEYKQIKIMETECNI